MQQTTTRTTQMPSNIMKRKESKKRDRAKISAQDILSMMKDVQGNLIKPQPQKLLGGNMGVTLSDVADSLGVTHAELKRKIDRSGEINYLSAFNHEVMTYVITSAPGKKVESYVVDVAAAQHIVAKYDNLPGRYYLDFLIRCKDALKVSLDAYQKIEEQLDEAKSSLSEATKQISIFTKPRITKKNNVVLKRLVAERSDLFHDTVYKVDREIIKQPKKNEPSYEQHYVQKLAKISKGNAISIKKALKAMECNMEALNKRVEQMSEASNDVDALINPEDEATYHQLLKNIEREEARHDPRN